jgi:hypothetical protein
MTRRLRRLAGDASGANLLEAALVTPLVLLLTFSVIELSMVFFVYLALENGVTQATRTGVSSAAGSGRAESLKNAMRDATPTLTIPDDAFTFSHLSPGASAWVSGPGGPDDIERITIDYRWELLTPVLRPLFSGGEVHMRVESSRKNEWRPE